MYSKTYKDDKITLYCGCEYDNKKPKLTACGYDSSNMGQASRATRTEAEHIVPASWYGQTRACWRTNVCPNKQNRECCYAIDYTFRVAHNDLFNLAPAIGQVNALRSNHPYAEIPGEDRNFGSCDFEFENDEAEPKSDIRGDIVRIYFYMKQTYGLTASQQDETLLQTRSQADPLDATELARNNRIKAVQGSGNPFVENH